MHFSHHNSRIVYSDCGFIASFYLLHCIMSAGCASHSVFSLPYHVSSFVLLQFRLRNYKTADGLEIQAEAPEM
jgi:hypothetical protein